MFTVTYPKVVSLFCIFKSNLKSIYYLILCSFYNLISPFHKKFIV
jgi:hypothetical protein